MNTPFTHSTIDTHTYTHNMSSDNESGPKRKQANISKDSPDKYTCDNDKSDKITTLHFSLKDFIKSKFESLHSAEQTLATKLC